MKKEMKIIKNILKGLASFFAFMITLLINQKLQIDNSTVSILIHSVPFLLLLVSIDYFKTAQITIDSRG